MKQPYTRELTIAELAALPDEDVDYSDIPELDETFWKNARIENRKQRDFTDKRKPHV
jgi:hypothetical protein